MKPKALLSLLAVTGTFLHAEIAPAQTLPSNVQNLPVDNTLGTPGSSADNLAVAVGANNLLQSSPAKSIAQHQATDVKIPGETRDVIARAAENLFAALNGIINIQVATFLPIDPNSLAVGSNAQLNVGMALVKSANNDREGTDRQVQQYIANSNNSHNPPLAKNATSEANVERTTSKNWSQPDLPKDTVGDLAQSKPKSSTTINESGTVSKNNPSEIKVPPTVNPIAAMTLPPLTPIISNQNKKSVASITGSANQSGTLSKNNPGETKVPPAVNPIAAMTLPPLTPIISNQNKKSVASTANETDRVKNPGKIEEARERDKLSLDRPNSSTSNQKVTPSITSANTIQKIAPLDVNLIVSNDLLVKKDELGDLNIYSADTLGITNSSGISSTSLSQGKTGDLVVISDRMLLKNSIITTPLMATTNRLLVKNIGESAIDPGNATGKKDGNKEQIALADTSNRLSLACGVALGEDKFTLVGKGGLLASPKDSLDSDVILQQDSLGIKISPSNWLCDHPAH